MANQTVKKADLASRIAIGDDPLMNVATAAERLSTTETHVRELIRTGRLTHVRIGRFMRVPTSALHAFVAGGTALGRQ